MHNGQIGGYDRIRRALDQLIPDEYYAARQGTTDSELIFYLMFRHGLERDPARALESTVSLILDTMARHCVAEPFRMTASLTDGETIWALRFSSDKEPPSLYYRCVEDGLMVVSEPLDQVADHWHPVPPGHLLTATSCHKVALQSFAPEAAIGMDFAGA
jgi:glutamine amidotransferase